ncbi:MAG: hypothetical protein IJV91_01430, partial [Kiritimatiellae bacterium]|nr:hypothetical protein [Kiritimatiellia bacterium]
MRNKGDLEVMQVEVCDIMRSVCILAVAVITANAAVAADLRVARADGMKVDGSVSDYSYANADSTDAFIVFDRESETLNGAYVPVGKPFCELRTTASVLGDATNLYVSFSAPMDPAHKAGANDLVGVALSPDGREVFAVECTVRRKLKVERIDETGRRKQIVDSGVCVGVSVGKWSFAVEFAIPYSLFGRKRTETGEAWLCNFYRKGDSCGGMSSWAPVQGEEFNPDRFGRILFGECRFGKDAVLPENRGKTVFLWEGNRWRGFAGGEGPDVPVPLHEREMEGVSLWSPLGGRAVACFRVSNLTDRPALYSLKPENMGKNVLSDRLRFREVAYVELRGGPVIPDPIFDLPNGTVFRIPAKSTAIMYVDADVDGMKPGMHKTAVKMVAGYSKFPEKSFTVNMLVGRADVREVKMPTWTYGSGRWPYDLRDTKDYRINTFCMLEPQFAPRPGSDGKRDWSRFDEVMQAMLANGIKTDEMYLRFAHLFPKWANPRENPKREQELIAGIRAGIAYAKERYGIGIDRIFFSTVDEPHGDPDDPKTSASFAFYGARLAKRINPNLKSWTNPFKASEKRYLPRYFREFDILEPYLTNINSVAPETSEMYAKSGKEIWSYSIFLKQNRPHQYRGISWRNFAYGFEGPATFYDLYAMSEDGFNSYDKSRQFQYADYGAMYGWSRKNPAVPSLRLEAWYQGHIEQRLLKWCIMKLSAVKADAKIADWRKRIDVLVKSSMMPRPDYDLLSLSLLKLSDEIYSLEVSADTLNMENI